MTVKDAVKMVFSNVEIGSTYTKEEIVDRVRKKYRINRENIVPIDYCYNQKDNENNLDNYLHIFEFLNNGKYKYLGENYSK